MDRIETRHLLIHGRVQGVGFRRGMLCMAQDMGVSGWVRNRGDGSVEVMLIGRSSALAALMVWAHHGPPGAHVDFMSVDDMEMVGSDGLQGFFLYPDD